MASSAGDVLCQQSHTAWNGGQLSPFEPMTLPCRWIGWVPLCNRTVSATDDCVGGLVAVTRLSAPWRGQTLQPAGLKQSHASPPHPLHLRTADSRMGLSCSGFHGCHARAGLYHTFRRGNRRFCLKFLPLCASSSGAPGGKVRHADRVPGEVQPSARTVID